MRHSGSHMARLVDENGRTKGAIALEDILEELVGEVADATRRRAPAENKLLPPGKARRRAVPE